MRKYLPIAVFSLASSSSFALPPHAAPGLVPGANHHTGDAGFVADLGREPKAGEEKLRMHEHFVAVRTRLAAGTATRPELVAKRQKLLAFLDAYIAKGTTPDNAHLPWRTPVFIDDQHTICAVGYLIEQSAGHALAEKIAQSHRYSFIEDIAKDMPEVRAWVAESGFTLDELGQIQPGYQGPEVLLWRTWDLAKTAGPDDDADDDRFVADGAYTKAGLVGMIAKHRMEGDWVRRSTDPESDRVVGKGTFHHGKGTWTSFYESGTPMATGDYVRNKPSGAWQFFHESGNLAAEGSFDKGQRVGKWRFYYDTADKTPIAIGAFASDGSVSGKWRHFDARGGLLATSVVDTPDSWHKEKQLFWSVGYLLDVVPTADRIHHLIHQGSIDGGEIRLDELTTGDGKERIYLRGDDVFDVDGHKLVAVDGGWFSSDCKWSKARKRAAHGGDISALHGLMFHDAEQACTDGGTFVPEARAQRISTLVDSMQEVRSASPEFITELALGHRNAATDLPDLLAANMSLDIEWPHVDGRFTLVYGTLPGYRKNY